jgi:hypothetical protein
VADVLTEAIEASLDPVILPPNDRRPPAEWSGSQVLDVADSSTSPDQDRRLSELLERQQRQSLTREEPAELAALMYHSG